MAEREWKGTCKRLRLLTGRLVACSISFAKALTRWPGLEPAWKSEEEWAADLAAFVYAVEAEMKAVQKKLTA